MTKVGIADLKAHLSRFLKAVRRGETIAVLDRETPVARIVPIATSANGLVVRRRKDPKGRLADVPLPPRPAKLRTDAVALLLEDRENGR